MATYRVTKDLGGRFRLGAIVDLGKGTAAQIARDAGFEMADAFQPVALGEHHSERPPVQIREIKMPLMLPTIPARNVAELKAQIEELEAKQETTAQAMEAARSLHGIKHGLMILLAQKHQLSGADKTTFDALARLREERDAEMMTYHAAQINLLAGQQEISRLKELLGEQISPPTLEAHAQLRALALELAQHDPVLLSDQRAASLTWRSSVQFTHGPVVADLHEKYCALLVTLSSLEPQRAIISPAARELAAWAQATVQAVNP